MTEHNLSRGGPKMKSSRGARELELMLAGGRLRIEVLELVAVPNLR